MLKIGDIIMKNPVVLAPMAGVCNPAFRLIAKEFGAGLVCAEMVSDKAILYKNEKSLKMLYVDEREKPLSLQIFGGDKKTLVEAAKVVDKQTNADIIDINMGCPARKVIKKRAGAALLKDPKKIGEIFGIFKAYCTRVGSGPFPTELKDTTGDRLREQGREYGSTTGRPRRCGWLDLPSLKYSIMINGVTQLFMTKSDVLSGLKTIKICTSYTCEGKECDEIAFHNQFLEPVYKEFEGWQEDISVLRDFAKLPEKLREYIQFIEEQTNVPVTIVSVGPDREETIFRK